MPKDCSWERGDGIFPIGSHFFPYSPISSAGRAGFKAESPLSGGRRAENFQFPYHFVPFVPFVPCSLSGLPARLTPKATQTQGTGAGALSRCPSEMVRGYHKGRQGANVIKSPKYNSPGSGACVYKRWEWFAIIVAPHALGFAHSAVCASGSGSVVEHLLAKEGVASSNLVFRSIDLAQS